MTREQRPPVTREKLRQLRADGIGWPEIAERFGRSSKYLRQVAAGTLPAPHGRVHHPIIAPSRAAEVLSMLRERSTHAVAREIGVSQSALHRWARGQAERTP